VSVDLADEGTRLAVVERVVAMLDALAHHTPLEDREAWTALANARTEATIAQRRMQERAAL
jgi:hypothetical protein